MHSCQPFYTFTQHFDLLTFVQVGTVNTIAALVANGEQSGSGSGSGGIGVNSGTGFYGVVSPGDSTSCPWNQNGCTNQDLGGIPGGQQHLLDAYCGLGACSR